MQVHKSFDSLLQEARKKKDCNATETIPIQNPLKANFKNCTAISFATQSFDVEKLAAPLATTNFQLCAKMD
jgi:hypothetical protein